jgi:predicted nuclease with TOPRIM domain
MPTNKTNFFEIKNMLIILLGIMVVGMFLFGKNVINKHATEIKALQTENTTLLNKNESLKKDNDKLDIILGQIDLKLSQNNKDTDAVLSELDKLNGKKNEIPNYVNSLSANSTADALAKYLENRTKGDGSKH